MPWVPRRFRKVTVAMKAWLINHTPWAKMKIIIHGCHVLTKSLSFATDAQMRFRAKPLNTQLLHSSLTKIGSQTPRSFPYLHDHSQVTQWPNDEQFNTSWQFWICFSNNWCRVCLLGLCTLTNMLIQNDVIIMHCDSWYMGQKARMGFSLVDQSTHISLEW